MGKHKHKSAPFMCGQCKAGFNSQASTEQHVRAAHADFEKVGVFKRVAQITGPEWEPSLADRAVDAEIARAMGEHSDDDWLLP